MSTWDDVADFFLGYETEPYQAPGKAGKAKTLTGKQKKLLKNVTSLLMEKLGTGEPPYPEQITPEESPIQAELFQFMEDLLAGRGLGEDAQRVMSEALGEFDPEATEQYWREAIYEPALARFEEDILPQVLEPFAGANALDSGAARRMTARAGTDLTRDLNAVLAELMFGEKRAHKAEALGTVANILPRYATMGTGLGGVQRAIEQEEGAEEYSKWVGSRAYNNPWLRLIPAALNTQAFEPIVTPGVSTPGNLSPLISAGANVGSALISAK